MRLTDASTHAFSSFESDAVLAPEICNDGYGLPSSPCSLVIVRHECDLGR